MLQVILHKQDWKPKPLYNIKHSSSQCPRSLGHSSAKLSTHSSLQSNKTGRSCLTQKQKPTGLVPAVLAGLFQSLNYRHHWSFLTCQLLLLLSQIGLKSPNSQLSKHPPYRFSFLCSTLHHSLGTETELRSLLLPWFDFMQWRRELKPSLQSQHFLSLLQGPRGNCRHSSTLSLWDLPVSSGK